MCTCMLPAQSLSPDSSDPERNNTDLNFNTTNASPDVNPEMKQAWWVHVLWIQSCWCWWHKDYLTFTSTTSKYKRSPASIGREDKTRAEYWSLLAQAFIRNAIWNVALCYQDPDRGLKSTFCMLSWNQHFSRSCQSSVDTFLLNSSAYSSAS